VNTILIHTESKQQVKLFEDLAKALGIEYEVENENPSAFMQEFNEAQQTGFTVEESRQRTLNFVDNLWRK
jgi:hypothetical protein